MKKILIIFMLVQIVTIFGCVIPDDKTSQNGDRVTKTYEISNFTKLDISNAFDVKVKVGEDISLKITADEDVHPNIKVENVDNTLILGLNDFFNNAKNIRAEITVKELVGLDASGACKIFIEGISTNSFEVDLSGACRGELAGNVKRFEVDLSGASNLEAKNLLAEKVEIDVSGASNAKVYATLSLEAEASGASNISIYGDPEKVETDVSGASNIKSK